ncbi:putative NBD/HSP70 family sugar kinase [Mumia flava]|uniref:Putative NBD/HSP70 family sugar kinase n=1 Tax=Mumia flava TaxID=1348852 RepID=A0A0B2B7C6_9ACTN|nr:ROK family transcriptional regulator [Mumia flava]PJJ55806.1 putative NBD/HSP70 family sugar kinase [Mumia flava]
MPAPGTTSALRAANLERVVETLRAGRAMTQAEIARRTDLAPATVSNIVRGLAADGLVETSGSGGRGGLAVRIAPGAGYVVGVDFGHSHLSVALGDLAGRTVGVVDEPIDNDHDHRYGLERARRLLSGLLGDAGADPAAVRAAGLGLPAPIDRDGRVVAASILPGWVGVSASKVAASAFGVPVLVDNDANLGALAEHRRSDPAVGSLAYLKAGSGVGCGLILNDDIYHGGLGTAGELGHVTLDESGPLCRCGSRGCLEAYAGGSGIVAQLEARVPELSVSGITDLVADGDTGAARLVEDAGRALGQGCAILVNLLSPESIVIGGDLACPALLDGVRDGLRRHAVGTLGSDVSLSLSTLGDRASVTGALMLALRSVPLSAA